MMEVQQFRKKPVVIEAVKYWSFDASDIAEWCGGKVVFLIPDVEGDCAWFIEIPTLEGTMRAKEGDWILKGVAGEFYPCAEEIFTQTYEAVTS